MIDRFLELFRPHFPESGFVVFRHLPFPCPKKNMTLNVPYQQGHQAHSLSELASIAVENLNQSKTLNCHGCGSILKPIKAIPADTTKVTDAIEAWLSDRKIRDR
ncbi:MAG: hypothetical protein NTZ93_00995 [Candidatus Beckwithbacteria bacterium]|nr:hypothetical protein [Candidatus Beckwithbacteria bacterium]